MRKRKEAKAPGGKEDMRADCGEKWKAGEEVGAAEAMEEEGEVSLMSARVCLMYIWLC